MEFRDLKTQYKKLQPEIDAALAKVLAQANYISGAEVTELERILAEYTGRKYCISCANGTDALSLAMMALGIGEGHAVFVPDFTFFASGETAAHEGAVPVFVDVLEETFNLSPASLEEAVIQVKKEGKYEPKAVVVVDLFGQPADFDAIQEIADKYGLYLIEDAAQGFGGNIRGRMACDFGDISTTSFFPAKPLGCYGDGGAVFTDSEEYAELIRSYRIHGKGRDKYDNVRIGRNSRLDTLQASILQVKWKAFVDYELKDINRIAERYTAFLQDTVRTPVVLEGFLSSWAQYTILLQDKLKRDGLQQFLQEQGIPSMVYYRKPMHLQEAFADKRCQYVDLSVTEKICDRVLSLPLHPYLSEKDQDKVIETIKSYQNI